MENSLAIHIEIEALKDKLHQERFCLGRRRFVPDPQLRRDRRGERPLSGHVLQ